MSATLSARTSVEELLRPIARYWWLWAAFGLLSIVAGVIALANLDLSLVALGVLFGCWLIAVGFFDVLGGVMAEDAGTTRRVLAVLLGVISLIAGVMCLRLPSAGLLALVIVVGAYLIVAGALQIAGAVGDDQPLVGFGLGVVNLVLGILILALPSLSLVTFALLFGIGLLVRGAVALWAGLRLRRLRPGARDRTVRGSTPRAVGP
jgi:uncharacterized membrane protein HdeD (DUF308 family)